MLNSADLLMLATCSLRHPTPDVVEQQGGLRGMLSTPADVLLVATARDALAYEYSGKSNRDGETYVKTSWGHTEVSCCIMLTCSVRFLRFIRLPPRQSLTQPAAVTPGVAAAVRGHNCGAAARHVDGPGGRSGGDSHPKAGACLCRPHGQVAGRLPGCPVRRGRDRSAAGARRRGDACRGASALSKTSSCPGRRCRLCADRCAHLCKKVKLAG